MLRWLSLLRAGAPQPEPPALLSLEAHQTRFGATFNLAHAGGDGLIDALSLAVAVTAASLFWRELSLTELLFLAANAAATLAAATLRRLHPSAYADWRECLSASLLVGLVLSPATWHITQLALQRLAPLFASSAAHPALSLLAYLLALALGSWAAPAAILALGRPLRLCLHLPAQALLVAVVAAHSGTHCATPALQHPAAVAATRALHGGLSTAASLLLPLNAAFSGSKTGIAGEEQLLSAAEEAAASGAVSQQQCQVLLSFTALLLGLGLPTAVLAAAECRLFLEHQRRQAQHLQHQAHSHEHHAVPGMQSDVAEPAGPPAQGTAPRAAGGEQAAAAAPAAAAAAAAAVSESPAGASGPVRPRLASRPVAAVRWRPSAQAVAFTYRGMHSVLADPADPWLRWLLAADVAAAVWHLTCLLCMLGPS